MCGYANRQHELELEIGADDIAASSFYRALQIASGLLLILDKEAKPFSRTPKSKAKAMSHFAGSDENIPFVFVQIPIHHRLICVQLLFLAFPYIAVPPASDRNRCHLLAVFCQRGK